MYEKFQTDEYCSLPCKVSFEDIKHIQELYNRGIKEPILKDQEESSPYDQSIDKDLNEVLGITNKLTEICNDMQPSDLSNFNFGKIYYWGRHKTKVSHCI
jgi:hypothetical protein